MGTRRGAIATLALDQAAVEAVRALESANVRAILLKGRSFAEWLYGAGECRLYADVDLLISDVRWNQAHDALTDLGYEPHFAPRHDPDHASAYGRQRDGMSIDLHRSLQGLSAPALTVWEALSAHTSNMRVGGADIAVLDEVGRCLSVAVHAGRSDVTGVRARGDLDRAIAIANEETWLAARDLAEVVGGADAFAAGLASTGAGRRLAAAIGVHAARAAGPDALRGVSSVQRALASDSLGEGLGQLTRWLVPTPSLLRQTRPVARKGTTGMAVAYVTWPLWLVVQFVRAVAARS